eukprot:GHVP01051818.1.p1 GENE.GHVP01051818.1~~GHVP01051818.1.p1  ORF type:complete len:263 (+),score=39.11 GHVP01051818.1:148-936(+)
MEFKHLSDQLNSALEHVTSPQGVGTLPDELIPEPAFSMIQCLAVVNKKGEYSYVEKQKQSKQKELSIVKILMEDPETYGDFPGYQKGLADRFSVKALGNPNSVTTLKQHRESLSQHLTLYREDNEGSDCPVTFIGDDPLSHEPVPDDAALLLEKLGNGGTVETKPYTWIIKACHCVNPQRPTTGTYHPDTLKDSCPCETFEVKVVDQSFVGFQAIGALSSCFYDEPPKPTSYSVGYESDQEDTSTLGEEMVPTNSNKNTPPR